MNSKNKAYLIGETAFHHQGDVDFLLGLIKAGKASGIDALKVHLLLDLEDYMVADHQAIEILRPWCLNKEDWLKVFQSTRDNDLDLIVLCNDLFSLKWINQLTIPVEAIEIHSTGLNDLFLLEEAAKFSNTVILGTGGSTIDEIEFAVEYLRNKGKSDIFLMHGFQNYPTDFADINLSKMRLLKEIFHLHVGYADHTDPNDMDNAFISCLPVGAGYPVLEKHFTTNFGEKRVDSQAAVSLEVLKDIRRLMDKALLAYGSDSIIMSEAEKLYGNTGPMKKAIVARHDLKKGEVLKMEDIAYKRTNESSPLKQLDLMKLINMELKKDIKRDEIITTDSIEFSFQKPDFSQFQISKK